MSSRNEQVVIVDHKNHVVGSVPRHRIRAERLVYRATYIFVFNSRGELFLQKRTPTKDMYPGYYDAAAGGVVQAGEGYDESARRELAEELGIRGVPLERLFDFYYFDELNRVWGRAYSVVFDGEIVLQPEEIESGRFCSVDDVLAGRVEPLTPDSLFALRRFRAGAEKQPPLS